MKDTDKEIKIFSPYLIELSIKLFKHLLIKSFLPFKNIFSGISVDWEDRQYFVSYQNRVNYNSSIDTFFLQKARIGFAPYVGDYGDFHTWVMLQVESMTKTKNKIIYTPMLRMFKGDFLTEVGLTNYKDFMFNFIKRF